jgi:plastocyanin
MMHLTALRPTAQAIASARRRAPHLAIATAVACGLGLAEGVPALAGTVLRGRVQIPATVPARAGQAAGSLASVNATDAVIYVTERPGAGKRQLAGRPVRAKVDLAGEGFSPWVLAVTVRSKVRFRNRGHVYHSLFSVSPAGRSDLGSLAPGKDRETRFDQPGVYNLFCQLHPSAAGFVIVCPNWFYTRAAASGDYVLPPLPRGAYILHAWHPRLGEVQRPIEVTGRDVIRVDLSL